MMRPESIQSQTDMYHDVVREGAQRDLLFFDMIKGPDALTAKELTALVAKRPHLWGRYAGFIGQLK